MPSLYDRTFGPTEEEEPRRGPTVERAQAMRPSFRMSSAGRRAPGTGTSSMDRIVGLGEAAASMGTEMLSQVPAGVATMGALPFGVKRAANIGDEVSKALTYLPRSKAGADVLEALEKPMAAMGAPGSAAGEEVMRRTGSPLLATATEMVVQPLNLLAAPMVGRGAVRGARAAGRAAQAAGRELGPKAAEMAESYMRRSGMMPEITTYHGSPHVFAPEEGAPLGRFRSEKIGTGEGAQAYGHGSYLAEEPAVATRYAEQLGQAQSVLDAAPRSEFQRQVQEKLRRGVEESRGAGAGVPTIDDLLDWVSNVEGPHYNSSMDAARTAVKRLAAQIPGSLYTVDIPDNMIGRMLDWDKPLSQQGQIGRSIIEALSAEELLPKATRRNEGRLTGRDAYEVFSDFLSPAGASREFQGFGIPGIKFLDEGGRAAGKGTRNFVVFPGEEKNLTILQRNEQRLPQTDTPAFKEFTAGAPVIKADQATKAEFQTGKPVVIEGFSGTRRDFSRDRPCAVERGLLPEQQAGGGRRVRRGLPGGHGRRVVPYWGQHPEVVRADGQPAVRERPRCELQPDRHPRGPGVRAADVEHRHAELLGEAAGLRRGDLQGSAGLGLAPWRAERAGVERLRVVQAQLREVGDREPRDV
jgi:hypothetical protein